MSQRSESSAKYFFKSAITASASCGATRLPEKSFLPSPIFSPHFGARFARDRLFFLNLNVEQQHLVERTGVQNVVRIDQLLDFFDDIVQVAQPAVRQRPLRAQARHYTD